MEGGPPELPPIPPGWFDPPAPVLATHPSPSPGRAPWVPAVVLGLVVLGAGAAVAVVSLLYAVLSANACGAFADGCDEYGETGEGFEVAVVVFVGSAAVAALGLVVLLVGVVGASVRALRR